MGFSETDGTNHSIFFFRKASQRNQCISTYFLTFIQAYRDEYVNK